MLNEKSPKFHSVYIRTVNFKIISRTKFFHIHEVWLVLKMDAKRLKLASKIFRIVSTVYDPYLVT